MIYLSGEAGRLIERKDPSEWILEGKVIVKLLG